MILLKLLVCAMPWPLRRRLLRWFFGYELHPTSRIGWSWIFPRRLVMGPHTVIDHLTLCKGLDALVLDSHAYIGRLNWITGHPKADARHFAHLPDRRPELILGEHAAITNRHLIDCTACVTIGAFATLAGFRSQVLSHSIDLDLSRQSAAPIDIGAYCFVGTGSVILAGSALPGHCVLGANSLLNKRYDEPYRLYAGNPARPIKELRHSAQYFTRPAGFVD